MSVRRYLLGCDLAKSMDFTSFAIIDMQWHPEIKVFKYHLQALDRIKGVDYPQICELIISTVEMLEAREIQAYIKSSPNFADSGPHLCMDASGLGAPIKDFLKGKYFFQQKNRKLWPVVFTGGEAARYDQITKNYNISKSKIISNFLSLMQHGRFDYSPDLAALPLLEEEIQNFQYHATPSGHIGMDAAPGKHDDLICAICIPLIIAEWRLTAGYK